jgi:hypothetical protein
MQDRKSLGASTKSNPNKTPSDFAHSQKLTISSQKQTADALRAPAVSNTGMILAEPAAAS